jgi:hypothetical protein
MPPVPYAVLDESLRVLLFESCRASGNILALYRDDDIEVVVTNCDHLHYNINLVLTFSSRVRSIRKNLRKKLSLNALITQMLSPYRPRQCSG